MEIRLGLVNIKVQRDDINRENHENDEVSIENDKQNESGGYRTLSFSSFITKSVARRSRKVQHTKLSINETSPSIPSEFHVLLKISRISGRLLIRLFIGAANSNHEKNFCSKKASKDGLKQ